MKRRSAKQLAAIHSGTFLVLLAVFTIVALLMPFPSRAMDVYVWLVPVFTLYLGGFHLMYVLRSGRPTRRKKT